ncbi:hypothetical protein FA15DRAFT_675799 [Coprinopsis marcescibilis]|uniref:Uncharacterized protein n=1 Tax=Coprinopsis marcescibilis TaxID=230819 RepID=A0A5C3KD63_COPMA|nr:hypothetical protein FA15DRAFT_675799 [Coprinopsis marcescibilis]
MASFETGRESLAEGQRAWVLSNAKQAPSRCHSLYGALCSRGNRRCWMPPCCNSGYSATIAYGAIPITLDTSSSFWDDKPHSLSRH